MTINSATDYSRPLGFQQLATLTSAIGLTLPAETDTLHKPRYAVIHAEGQAVRWRDDGTNPSTTVGMRILAGGELVYDGNLSAIKFIEETGSAKLNVSYYG